MDYYIEAQFLPKGSDRPLDQGHTLGVKTDDKGFAILPAVGDFVLVSQGLDDTEGRAQFRGKVVSRMFHYIGKACGVNIVVAETDDDWGKLIKE